jgi:hypothetical protein
MGRALKLLGGGGAVLRLNHYSAICAKGSPACVEFDVSLPGAQALHQHFEPLVRQHTVRSINWEQSFARRAAHLKDYVLKHSATRARGSEQYQFYRRAQAAKALPMKQCFSRDTAVETSLQGEVLTYLKSIPLLSAVPRSWIKMPANGLPEDTRRDLSEVTYLFTRLQMQKFFELPAGSFGDSIFDAELCVGWDAATSFLTVTNVA